MGVCGIFRPPVQGDSNELISKFLSSMILYNHHSYFKSGEINSCRLSPLPNIRQHTKHAQFCFELRCRLFLSEPLQIDSSRLTHDFTYNGVSSHMISIR